MTTWPTIKLGDATRRIGGGTPSRKEPSYWGGDLPWFTVADLKDIDNIQELTTSRECITKKGLKNSAAKLVPAGAIVFSSRVVVGKVGISKNELVTNQDFSSFVPINSIDTEFLAYFLIKVKADLRGHQRGATIKGVTTRVLDSVDVPHPSLTEQHRVVARIKECMERVGEIEALRTESCNECSIVLRAYYHDLYRGLVQRYTTIPLVDAGIAKGGGTPSKKHNDFWNGDIPWISPKEMKRRDLFNATQNITEAAIEGSSTKLIKEPSVLLVVRGMILSHTLPVAVNRVPVTINQDMKAITPRDNIKVDFLAAMLRGSERELLSKVEVAGHGTRRLQTAHWSALPVPIISEQDQAAIVSEVLNMEAVADALIRDVEFDEIRLLRGSILSKAFAGEL